MICIYIYSIDCKLDPHYCSCASPSIHPKHVLVLLGKPIQTNLKAKDKINVIKSERDRFWGHYRNHIGIHPAINHHDQNSSSRWPMAPSSRDLWRWREIYLGRSKNHHFNAQFNSSKRSAFLRHEDTTVLFSISTKYVGIMCFNLCANGLHCASEVWMSAGFRFSCCGMRWA